MGLGVVVLVVGGSVAKREREAMRKSDKKLGIKERAR